MSRTAKKSKETNQHEKKSPAGTRRSAGPRRSRKGKSSDFVALYVLVKFLKKLRFRRRKSCLLPLALLVLMGCLCLFVPDFGYNLRYYFLAGRDWLLELIGVSGGYDNLEFGAPEGKDVDCIFEREGYAFGYSEIHEQPLWVIYKLTADELNGKRVARTDDFREDPRVRTRSASPEDYKGSGYDRGHLAPAADMAWDEDAMSDSFYMSNMSPQRPECNRGIWVDLESQVRDFARWEKEIFVVTGPVFYEGQSVRSIGVESKVSVPHAYYKVIYDLTPPCKMIGFIIPNKGGEKDLKDYAVTVRTVEEETGLTFFPKLPAGQAALKNTISVSDWNWTKSK